MAVIMIKVRKQIQFLLIEESKMSIDLINSVINGDYVSANRLFEERLANIQEKKLYELKRMMQAEVFGGLSKDEIEARRKAGYRKASEVLGDPTKTANLSVATKKYRASLKKKKVSEETLDEMRAPGEVAGSDERKMDAMKLRAVRAAYGPDKKGSAAFRSDYLSARKSQMSSGTSSSDSSDAEMEKTGQLKKLPSLADMKKASREERMARIGARAERLRQRGHSDPGRHLARAYGTSIGDKIGRAIKTPAKIAAGVASDIANAVALEE